VSAQNFHPFSLCIDILSALVNRGHGWIHGTFKGFEDGRGLGYVGSLLILSYVKFLFHFTLIICENTQIA
jgi:hypothetical protein